MKVSLKYLIHKYGRDVKESEYKDCDLITKIEIVDQSVHLHA